MFEEIIKKLMDVEGGYSNDPSDVGGETICGIARNYWPHWDGWKIVDMMKSEGSKPTPTPGIVALAMDFYKRQFWDTIRGDSLIDMDVAYEMMDISINLGQGKARTLLQESLNLLNRNGLGWDELLEDGRIGPKTLDTLRVALSSRNGSKDLCKVLNTLQGMHYINVVRAKPTQERFLRGWLDRT